MRRLVLLLVPALLLLAVGASVASAEEPSALERLTPEERTYLEQQVPDWAQLSPQRREGIARNVIRIRELPEEQRRALLERIERLKRGRALGRGPPPGRLEHHLDPKRRHEHRRRAHVMRAVRSVLWNALPDDTRTSIDAALGRHDRERFTRSLLRRLVGRIAKQLA